MRANDLLDAIGNAKDEYVHAAKHNKKKRIPGWVKGLSAAACLVLVVGAGLFALAMIGGRAGGGGNSGSGLTYMSYDGPVLPLTLSEENSGITARRDIDFDFSPYLPREEFYEDSKGEMKPYIQYDDEAIVTDSYTLTNNSGEDISATAIYPFVGTLREKEYYPTVSVDGIKVDPELNYGQYSGGFTGVWGAPDNDHAVSLNLAPCDSFDSYERLLGSGEYIASAFDEPPILDQPVTVYKMSDYEYTSDPEAANPTLNMEFCIDPDETTVLTYGITGGTYNSEDGYCARQSGAIEYRPNASPERREPGNAYVIFVGEDIDSYTIQGYKDGGCDEGEELDDLGCTVTRRETTLGDILRELVFEEWDLDDRNDAQTLLELTSELIVTSGPLGDLVQRYDDGMLDTMIAEASSHSRVIYLEFDIVIPAGSSVKIDAVTVKEASIDFVGKDTERNGYDMATQLGSNIIFTEQRASVSEYGEIEIIRQNFGFDLSAGITEVSLDLNEPHYWMEVRKIKTD